VTAAAFQATYSDMRLIKGRKVVQFVFEVPLEASNEAYDVLGGMPNPAAEVWCAIARLKPEASTREAASETPARKAASRNHVSPEHKMAQRAALLCKDVQFHRFLDCECRLHHDNDITENEAAFYVRKFCEVESRSEIRPGTNAGNRFDMLQSAFIAWRDKDKFVEAVE